MRWARLMLAVVLVSLVGCSFTEPVILRHTETGQTVQCGPYRASPPLRAIAAAEHEKTCIHDYQRQGYERVPK